MTNDWQTYEILSEDDPTSITWTSCGGDGSGKSYFGCTAPGPIFVCAFDPYGMSRVDKTIRTGKEIRIGRYGFNSIIYSGDRDKIRKAAIPVWERFVEEYRTALHNARTVLWDREDMSWGLRRYAAFGGQKNEGSRLGALDYGDLNEEYTGLLQEAKDAQVNLGLIQGLTDEWITKFDSGSGKMKSYRTGKEIPDGFRRAKDLADITLDHRWDAVTKQYVAKIGKFPTKQYKGTEIANLSFGEMAICAFPDSNVETWL
jgi:hypothetical protein